MNPIAATGTLTENERFMLESWGYLIIENVLNRSEIEECLEASIRLHRMAGTSGFGQVGCGYETEPALERLIDHPAVLPKIRGVYGDRFILQAGWNTIQPAHSPCGGWHQDGSSAYDFKKLGQPVPLIQLRASFLLTDQTKPGYGNMEMVPGSHKSALPLPEEIRRTKESLPISHTICAPAGSVLIFHNAVWHRPCKNEGDQDRYNMHYIYSPPWVRPSDRLRNNPDFLKRTTPLRRALLGEFERADQPYGRNYDAPPYDD